MKFIAKGGATSSNVVENTRDAILLAIHTNYIDGVALCVRLTKDLHPVLFSTTSITGVSSGTGYIKEHTLLELQQHNFGSKVKRQDILTLEDALTLFKNTTKILVLELMDEQERNKEFVDIVMSIVNQYPNINLYMKSRSKEMALYMNQFNTKAKIGIVLTENTPAMNAYNFDFYSVASNQIDPDFIQAKLQQNRVIMLESIQNVEDLIRIENSLGNLTNQVFVITANIIPIAAAYIAHTQGT